MQLPDDRSDLACLARLAEKCERYDDMVTFVKRMVAITGGGLNAEERALLAVAYKNASGLRRAASRVLHNAEADAKRHNESLTIAKYREKVEAEQYKICMDFIYLLDSALIPHAVFQPPEAQVFYCTLLGDYCRYITSLCPAADRDDIKQRALAAYNDAALSAMALPPAHPARLGLALNFSVFFYETMNAPEEAHKIAQKAFDAAIVEIESTTGKASHAATLTTQLIRDNLALWACGYDSHSRDHTQRKEDFETH